jgi:hypothetical protein
MTGRPCRRRYPLKKIDTDDKKGRSIYGNCGQCYPNVLEHSTDNCKYGPDAEDKSASFISRRYEHADSLGHDLADPEVVNTLHDMGWFDGDPDAVATEAWNITSLHDTQEKDDDHRFVPPTSPPQETAATTAQVTPPMSPPVAPPKNAIIHEAIRADVGIILLVAALACTDVITDTKTMAMAILIGFGFPAVLFFTLVEPAGAAMIHTMKLAPAMYGSKLSPQEWNSMMAHDVEWHSALVQQNTQATASTVDPMVCVLVVVCALAIVVMLMIQRGRATPELRLPSAAALNAELEAMATFRRQMTAYLGREPTTTELDDERRRLAYQAYGQEHGYSPLSPVPTPPQSPTSIVTDPPEVSEYSPISPPDSGDDDPADPEAERARAIAREEYELAFALRGRDEDQ